MHLPLPLTTALTLLLITPTLTHTQKTTFNGDILNHIPVITHLNLTDVPPNTITKYYFQAGEAQGTITYHIPVFVARGTKESLNTGRRLSLSSTVHGDEYNGVRVVQKVFADLEHRVKAGKFNGTIIGIPTVNMNGVMHNQRNCIYPPASYYIHGSESYAKKTPNSKSLLLLRKWFPHQHEPRLPRRRS